VKGSIAASEGELGEQEGAKREQKGSMGKQKGSCDIYPPYDLVSPFMTFFNTSNPSLAKAPIFPSLSPPNRVSASFVDVLFSVTTASGT